MIQRYEANLELVLAGPPTMPLKVIDLDHSSDPKGALAAVFGRLWPDEYAEIHVDRRDIPMHRAEKIRKWWASGEKEVVGRGTLAEPELQKGTPMGMASAKRLELKLLTSKLDPTQPLFECQILLHASSPDAQRATQIVLGLYTAMGREFSGANKLGVYGNQIPHVKFYSTDAFSWRRWWFHLRRETGLFWPSRPSIIAGFEGLIRAFSIPWTEPGTEAPVTSGQTVPPPPADLPRYDETDYESEEPLNESA